MLRMAENDAYATVTRVPCGFFARMPADEMNELAILRPHAGLRCFFSRPSALLMSDSMPRNRRNRMRGLR